MTLREMKDLISLANRLDKKGLHKEADAIDSVLIAMAEEEQMDEADDMDVQGLDNSAEDEEE